MKINSIYISGFGKLCDMKMDFGDGLTFVIGDNEFGKSTILAFIRAMFYGFPARSSSRVIDFDRKKYTPWQGNLFGGSMEFTHEGRRYLLEKVFGKRKADDRTTLSVLPVGRVLQTDHREIGEFLFDLSEAEFVNTVFVGQLASAFENTDRDASSLAARLSVDGDPGNFENDYDVVRTRLKNAINLLEQTRGQGGLIVRLDREREDLIASQAVWSQLCVQSEEWQAKLQEASALQKVLTKEISEAEQFAAEKDTEIATLRLRIREAELSLERKKQETNYARQMQEQRTAYAQEKETVFAMQKETIASQKKAVQREKALLDEKRSVVSQEEERQTRGDVQGRTKEARRNRPFIWGLGIALCIGLLALWASRNLLISLIGGLISFGLILLGFYLYERHKPGLPSENPNISFRQNNEKLSAEAKAQEKEYLASCALLAKLEKDFAEEEQNLSSKQTFMTKQIPADGVTEEGILKALFVLRENEAKQKGQIASALDYIQEHKSKRESLMIEIARMETNRENLVSACAKGANIDEQIRTLEAKIVLANEYRMDLQVAMRGMTAAAERMENDFVPRVNKRAGAYLFALTEGKYSAVHTDRTFHVSVATEGEYSYKDAGFFSGGTTDQVYLSIRLAISDILARKDHAMTILLDDSLVQYDDRRAKAAIRLFAEMSATRQIILFSCQTRMKELYGQVREEGKKA